MMSICTILFKDSLIIILNYRKYVFHVAMIEDQQGCERPVGGARPPNTILLGNCCLWYSSHRHQHRSIAHTQNYRLHQCQRIFHQLLRCLLFESSFLSDLLFIGLRLSFNRISALNRFLIFV